MTRNSRIDIALSAEADVYIERTADTLAWEALRRKEYVALLEPKHQGKTSLINRLRYSVRAPAMLLCMSICPRPRFARGGQVHMVLAPQARR